MAQFCKASRLISVHISIVIFRLCKNLRWWCSVIINHRDVRHGAWKKLILSWNKPGVKLYGMPRLVHTDKRTFHHPVCRSCLVGLGYWIVNTDSSSQAARQDFSVGLLIAVLMASAVVVLKHETSTHHQSHHLISNIFTFVVGDNVRRSPTFGSDPMSGRPATWGQQIRMLWLFNSSTAHTREPIFAHIRSKDVVWCTV